MGTSSRIYSEASAKADSTLECSQAVPNPGTSWALSRSTSEVERDPVHSTRYGRQRKTRFYMYQSYCFPNIKRGPSVVFAVK